MKRYVDNSFKAQIPVAELTVSLLLKPTSRTWSCEDPQMALRRQTASICTHWGYSVFD
jgi:hypothetical protein